MASYACLNSDEAFVTTVTNLIKIDDVDNIKLMFEGLTDEMKKKLVDFKYQENSALFTACYDGNLAMVKFFIDVCHADIEQKGVYCVEEVDESKHVVPPLWCASIGNKLDIVKFLIERGANINASSDSNSTSVRAACFRNNLEVVKLLVEKGADISIPNKSGSTCLMNAVECPELCEYLISKGADVNVMDKNGLTALHYAVIYNNIESVQVMLSNGAGAQLRSKEGYDALTMSALYSCEKVTDYFINEVGITVNEKILAYELMASKSIDEDRFDDCYNYLSKAMRLRGENPEVIICDEKSDFKAVFDNFKEPETVEELHEMVNAGNILLLSFLIKDRILGSKDYNTMYSLLRYASDHTHGWKSIHLFRYAFELYLEDGRVLMDNCLFAVSQILLELGNLLIEQPAKVFTVACEILSLLSKHIEKAMAYQKEKGKELESRKANNFQQSMMISLDFICMISNLRSTCEHDDFDLKSKIHSVIALDPRTTDRGRSLFHLAVHPGNIQRFYVAGSTSYKDLDFKVLEILLQSGASVNSFDKGQNTPLHTFIKSIDSFDDDILKNDIDVITFLLNHGAHIDTPNANGETPLDLMRTYAIPINELHYRNLQCLAARVIQKYRLKYSGEVPSSLLSFIERH